MNPVERAIAEHGGIASAAEILQRRCSRDMIKLFSEYGTVRRIPHGWYASPDLPEDAFRAWKAGGRLTCVSAAVHYGLWPHETEALHVRVAANASRVERSPEVVLHWSRGPMTGTRLAVSIDEALATIRRCQGPEVFHAVRRAANR
jgi:hypothetical protein